MKKTVITGECTCNEDGSCTVELHSADGSCDCVDGMSITLKCGPGCCGTDCC